MKKIIVLFLFFASIILQAQEHAWIYFKDKPNEAVYMENPLSMLTQRSLDRRITQNIALDFNDVPISLDYINEINIQEGVEVKAKSKWLNAVHVFGTELAINNTLNLSIVDRIEFAARGLNARTAIIENQETELDEQVFYDYGSSENQAHQIGVDFLHENDFTGKGIQIAVLDAGFPNVNNFDAFKRIRDNNQILGGYNYVSRSDNFYQGNNHGTSVLSTIAGYVEGKLVGTAPDASFYLFITEDVSSETPLEESLWVEAAEKADSLGVNVINTSLGYIGFDEAKYNHLYEDMDGKSTYISRGANIAVDRGMIVVVAAGNSGNSGTYNNIGSPADATNVFTIGAVNANGVIASFSSYGPSYDGRIKPDVTAKGLQTTVVSSSGAIVTGSGTSYASPIMAGAIASFWQAFPTKANFEIMQLIRESAHLYSIPINQSGNGIPNFKKAYEKIISRNESLDNMIIYPNPTTNEVFFKLNNKLEGIQVTVFDLIGRKIMQQNVSSNQSINLSSFQSGIYLFNFETPHGNFKRVKIIKR